MTGGRRWWAAVVVVVMSSSVLVAQAQARTTERFDVTVRGKVLSLQMYHPSAAPKGTVFMGSGDVGWVGLGVSMAEFLADEGYRVVGVNVRQYLSVFTVGKSHLEVSDVPADYLAMAEAVKAKGWLVQPVILSGVSEGAALSMLAATTTRNHEWVRGVITMGLPAIAELAWRWTDFTAWITKSDANEPSFNATEYVAQVSPLPLYMLQSVKDEYVTEAEYRLFEKTAKAPKKQVLIPASNHRFTDKRNELLAGYREGLAWVASVKAP